MEFPIRVLIVAILGLIAALIIVMMTGGIAGDAQNNTLSILDWFKGLTGGVAP